MKISVLSGKGGTGKTFISTNLANVLKGLYIDCDVEEPNGSIFLKPKIISKEEVNVKIPVVNENCTGCRDCVDFCKYNALAYAKDKLLVFSDLCHSCGGCTMICKYNALTEVDKRIGVVEYGQSENVEFKHGIIDSGIPSGVPIIKNLVTDIDKDKITIVDCPPGSSCTVMESIKESDFCILVTEPTLFGVQNLDMVYQLTKLMSIQCGIVINKAMDENTLVEDYCKLNNIPILGRILYDKQIGTIVSNGELITKHPKYKEMFEQIYDKVVEVVGSETNCSSKR